MIKEFIRENKRYITGCIGILGMVVTLAASGMWNNIITAVIIFLGLVLFFVFWKLLGCPSGEWERAARITMITWFLIAVTAIDYSLMTLCYFSAMVMCIAGVAVLMAPIVDEENNQEIISRDYPKDWVNLKTDVRYIDK